LTGKTKPKGNKMCLIWLRRLVQLLSLAFFLYLIGRNNYPLDFPIPPELFSRLSPLAALTASISARSLLTPFWPALFILVSALILGRAFCGWVCPLGTTIDITDKLFPVRKEKPGDKPSPASRVKYLILIGGISASLLGVQLVGYLDPLSIAPRSYIMGVLAPLELLARWLLSVAKGVGWLSPTANPFSSFANKHIFSFLAPNFPHWYVHTAIIVGIALLALWRRRGFCRMLCPLGALLGTVSRLAPMGRTVDAERCKDCGTCPAECKMGAIAGDGVGTFGGECILCLNCRSSCRLDAVHFRFASPLTRRKEEQELASAGPSRRAFIASIGTGLVLAAPRALGADLFLPKKKNNAPLRPPGALPEERFLGACIRCGQCMRVCPTWGLQPTLLEAGLAGMFSARLVPRIGYCEYNCNLCGRVCPSGAIQELPLEEKQISVIGLAVIDRNRCLPWAKNEECLVCEEVCPVPQKAIVLKGGGKGKRKGYKRIARPMVVTDLCIGCGICENRCPLEGKSAIVVEVGMVGGDS